MIVMMITMTRIRSRKKGDDEVDEEEDTLGEGLVHTGMHRLSAGLDVPRHLHNMLDSGDDDNNDEDKDEEEGAMRRMRKRPLRVKVLSTPGCTFSLQVWMCRDTCTT